jgi:hypothetical protein
VGSAVGHTAGALVRDAAACVVGAAVGCGMRTVVGDAVG